LHSLIKSNKEGLEVNQNRVFILSFFYILELIVSGCATTPIHSTNDPKVDISNYRTFKWLTQADAEALELENPTFEHLAGTVRVVSLPELNDKIRPLVIRDLEKNGYEESTQGIPDFYVTYYAKRKDEDWLSSWNGTTLSINNVPVVMFPGFERTKTREFRDGMVYLTFYDSKTKRPSWNVSFFSDRIGPSPDTPQIASVVEQLVMNFVTQS
jgi:hypothetical protein